MEPSIIVVGSCVIDFVSYTNIFPKPGETIRGTAFEMGFGGKGANQCVAAAKLGAKTALVGCVGNDSLGENYLKELCKYNNINYEHVTSVDGVSTGVASIIVNDEGENAIVIVCGANQSVSTDDVDKIEHLLKSCKVLVCQDEITELATLHALTIARKHKVLTLMNAAPARKEIHPDFFSLSDIFCVNESEAEALTGFSIASKEEAKRACEILHQKGCQDIVITLGKDGAVYFSSGRFEHIPAPKVDKAADTTGAGDSFVGSLAYFIAMRPDLTRKEMVDRACQIAAVSVQKNGTQKSFPLGSEVKNIIDT